MIRVVVIGSGNVAHHLVKALTAASGISLEGIVVRNSKNLENVTANIIDSYEFTTEADVYIIAVSDRAINEVSINLPFGNRLVVHTSGSAPMEEIDGSNRRGVFYPLQTFSKEKEIDFKKVPICLEAENQEDYTLLEKLASALSESVYRIDSSQRRALHVAAVFAANFTNHMYFLADDICRTHAMPFDLLKPLISEVAAKIQQLSPALAQTGPAVRHDEETIQRHLDLLTDENQKNIYLLLTRSIQQSHDKEL